ncbi:alpha/beta hydrolase family esterase [Variovorax sp. HJSM1_2]|uniref:extracellular catalytic domain type 1 short-chain-length polyhydroxyalkanoate depolymerase n=1 Tax=Variovorax sp. HJSM1_2 TaxID=3366263 RepID=UPI003BC38F8F
MSSFFFRRLLPTLRAFGGFVMLIGLMSPMAQAQTMRERIQEHMLERRAAAESNAATGILSEESLMHDGLRRSYLVHVPPKLDATHPLPLVLAFHGGGGDAAFMAQDARYGLISKADAAGFVVVFPGGFSRFPGGRFAAWNAGNCCGEARDRAVDDVGFVRALVQRLQATHRIDGRRVYAVGMSNGGMFAHRLGCEAADVFAAVASVAGTDNTRTCAPSRPMAVLHIHAKDDDHLLFAGGAGPASIGDKSKVTDFTSVPLTISRWVERDRCDAKTVRTLSVAGAYCEAHQACAGQAEVQLCVTETGGHSWPGATTVRKGQEAASQALSANDVMWEFFTRHRLP